MMLYCLFGINHRLRCCKESDNGISMLLIGNSFNLSKHNAVSTLGMQTFFCADVQLVLSIRQPSNTIVPYLSFTAVSTWT